MSLAGKVALVAGATRGAGRGIAVELGAAGATVYVTGRSTREADPGTYAGLLRQAAIARMPGSIEETAEEVTRAGGTGIFVRCDHTREEDVRALFDRVRSEQGRLDLLVNNAWGGHEAFSVAWFGLPLWEQPLEQWGATIDRGAFCHLLATRHAAALLQSGGLVVATTFSDRGRYLKGNFFYDLGKTLINRVALATAEELGPRGVTSVAVSPGWMRTELVLLAHQATEDTWRERPALARTESPRYLGRAVVALAADAGVARHNGQVLTVGDLARTYGFTDADGSQPEPFRMDA